MLKIETSDGLRKKSSDEYQKNILSDRIKTSHYENKTNRSTNKSEKRSSTEMINSIRFKLYDKYGKD